jgi:ribosomal peptide maturation radical SAM protein 1
MRVTLVNMPWMALNWPSLALSVLDSLLIGLGHRVTQYYGNLRFAEFVLEASGGELTPAAYTAVCNDGFRLGVGEWVFTSALYEPGWRREEYRSLLRRHDYHGFTPVDRMHALAPDFVRAAAAEILAGEPDLVGITSTFSQNVPSLALAAELKRLRPDVRIAMGGSNCDGPMGAALHRNYPQLDYVVRGEGERPLTELMAALSGDLPLPSVTSLCWRAPDGQAHENPYVSVATPGSRIPVANLAPFYEVVRRSPARPWISHLGLRLETSRGCWWGEKSHCTFCGLNDATMAFRSKPADVAWQEISAAVEEFGVLDVMLTDNILDPAYFETLFPRLAAADWDLRILYEVKSNLKPAQVAALAKAGVNLVQPGIESLSSTVLRLMRKGATGPGQVGQLRLFREHGVFPMWNYLCGFPGEDWERDYAPMVAQLPALVHLPPPEGVSRVKLERFAPLFTRPELGIDDSRRPTEWYPVVYDLPPSELDELAYVFDYPSCGITPAQEGELRDAIDAWRLDYERSALTYRAFDSTVVLSDRRAGWPARDHVLEGVPAVTYLTLTRHLTLPGLAAALEAGGYPADPDELAGWLRGWKADGLVFEDDGGWVALATHEDPLHQPSWTEYAVPAQESLVTR